MAIGETAKPGDQPRRPPDASLSWFQKPVFRPCLARRRPTKASCVSNVPKSFAYCQRAWSPRFRKGTVADAMGAAAKIDRRHPVRDWLDTLRWDGHPRIDTWLRRAFGARAGNAEDAEDAEADDAYHRAVGSKLLIAAVRRVRRPGVKFDDMMVLEGKQGIGKSTALKALFGADWCSDHVPPDLAHKEAAHALLGVWCMEFAEIEALIRSEVEVIKAFLSRPVDRFRPPWGKAFGTFPRQCVLVGTTNDTEYLRDATGNRRFWPVECHHADVEWITAERDQLWAEAAAREAGGEAIWLDDADVAATARRHQRDRLKEDAWTAPVRDYVELLSEVTAADILTHAVNTPVERHEGSLLNRIVKILKADGWTSDRQRRAGKPTRIWLRGDAEGRNAPA